MALYAADESSQDAHTIENAALLTSNFTLASEKHAGRWTILGGKNRIAFVVSPVAANHFAMVKKRWSRSRLDENTARSIVSRSAWLGRSEARSAQK